MKLNSCLIKISLSSIYRVLKYCPLKLLIVQVTWFHWINCIQKLIEESGYKTFGTWFQIIFITPRLFSGVFLTKDAHLPETFEVVPEFWHLITPYYFRIYFFSESTIGHRESIELFSDWLKFKVLFIKINYL